ANSRGKATGLAGSGDFVVEFAEGGAGLNPGCFSIHVEGDGPEIEHVEDDEGDVGDVGDAVVVMAAAADFELDSEGFRAENGGLDMDYA
ncbi:hypothetical protein U1Q18_010046, partial [Sarracenia purpurea var. burkii]